jgi:hypothetical protein
LLDMITVLCSCIRNIRVIRVIRMIGSLGLFGFGIQEVIRVLQAIQDLNMVIRVLRVIRVHRVTRTALFYLGVACRRGEQDGSRACCTSSVSAKCVGPSTCCGLRG